MGRVQPQPGRAGVSGAAARGADQTAGRVRGRGPLLMPQQARGGKTEVDRAEFGWVAQQPITTLSHFRPSPPSSLPKRSRRTDKPQWVLRLGPARTVASPGILLNPEREVMVAGKAPWPFLLPGPVSPCLLFDRGHSLRYLSSEKVNWNIMCPGGLLIKPRNSSGRHGRQNRKTPVKATPTLSGVWEFSTRLILALAMHSWVVPSRGTQRWSCIPTAILPSTPAAW